MTVTIREPQALDDVRVAVLMRRADVAECRAVGYSPYSALIEAQRTSARCWTGEVDGWPEAMFGVVPINAVVGVGSPWFLGSEKARASARQFLETAPAYLAQIEALFPRLEGMVSGNNTAAIRWLRRMGFMVEDRVTLMRGEPMLRFSKGF